MIFFRRAIFSPTFPITHLAAAFSLFQLPCCFSVMRSHYIVRGPLLFVRVPEVLIKLAPSGHWPRPLGFSLRFVWDSPAVQACINCLHVGRLPGARSPRFHLGLHSSLAWPAALLCVLVSLLQVLRRKKKCFLTFLLANLLFPVVLSL